MNLNDLRRAMSDLLLAGDDGSAVAAFSAASVNAFKAEVAAKDQLRAVHAVGMRRADNSLRFYVSDKDVGDLGLRAAIAEQLRISARVDVLPAPPAEVIPAASAVSPSGTGCTANRQSKLRPCICGISVGHFRITAGTIGAVVGSTRDGESGKFLLSNNHVLANLNQASSGDAILQPGPLDGGSIGSDRVSQLTRYIPIQLGFNAKNLIDAAICEVDGGVPIDTDICTIGSVGSVGTALEDMEVCKHGRTTGYTEGVVTDEVIDAHVYMDSNDPAKKVRFQNQIRIQVISPYEEWALGGDSGSLVVSKEGKEGVGLFFAGPKDGSYGYANPLDIVLNKLDIRIGAPT